MKSSSVTIQMKATEQYYPVQGGSDFLDRIKSLIVTNQINATEQYFPVVLFIIHSKR